MEKEKKHFIVSMIKSGLRIAAAILAIIFGSLPTLAIGFLIAEIVGIIEELVI